MLVHSSGSVQYLSLGSIQIGVDVIVQAKNAQEQLDLPNERRRGRRHAAHARQPMQQKSVARVSRFLGVQKRDDH